MPDVVAGALKPVLHPERRERREPAVHGNHRQTGLGNAVVWIASTSRDICCANTLPVSEWRGTCSGWATNAVTNAVAIHCPAGDACIAERGVRRLIRFMRLVPIYQTPTTSKKHPQHKIYPYVLRRLALARPNQVWCVDITYIPMRRGFLYLVAIMDWYSRKVLSWRLSNSMEADFCVEALKEAIARNGKPEIMNSDHDQPLSRHSPCECTAGQWIRAVSSLALNGYRR